MKKNMRRIAVAALGLIMIIQLAACGATKFDAQAYVNESLRAQYYQEYAEYAKIINEDEEAVRAEVEKSDKEEIDAILAAFPTIEEADIDAFYQTYLGILKNVKFEVGEAEKSGDNFIVPVTIEPLLIFDDLQTVAEAKLIEAYGDGTTMPTDQDYVTIMTEILNELNADPKYGESVSFDVEVVKNSDNVYEVSDTQIDELNMLMLPGL